MLNKVTQFTPHISINTVDWEIFALKIIRALNFRVKNILSLDSSAT